LLQITDRKYPKLKEVDDVLGGAAAWENVDSTSGNPFQPLVDSMQHRFFSFFIEFPFYSFNEYNGNSINNDFLLIFYSTHIIQ